MSFPRAWFRRLTTRAKTAVVVLCVLALAGASAALYQPVRDLLNPPCARDGATVVTHEGADGECIGITDGTYHFDPRMRAVDDLIHTENQKVVREHPNHWVSVVLLLPISSDSGSIMSMTNVIEQLRGAYTAQYYANHVQGVSPYIRLLIGSDGYQADESAAAAGTIIANASAQRIAAVSGLGLSLDGTVDAVHRLTAQEIPVFGATLTSDAFNNVKDFVRVSPSNADNTAVALSFVESQARNAVLVEDQNGGDSYDTTLVTGFRKFADIPGHHIVGVEAYDTTDRDRPHQSEQARQDAEDTVDTRISEMPVNICNAQPAVVLFGGRGQDLGTLVHALSTACLDKHITIISGDDVTNLPDTARLRQDLSGHVTVDYAGVAHPGEWAATRSSDPRAQQGRQGFDIFHQAFRGLFGDTSLSDGNTMMAYDATLTGVSAIRLTRTAQPTGAAVASELGALHDAYKVLGSSGPIEFTAAYRTSGTGSNPIGKAIPVLQLDRNGNSTVMDVRWPDHPAG